MRVLEIFTCHGGFVGGVATMVNSYMGGIEEFKAQDCILEHLNIAPTIKVGKSQIDNIFYIFTQRRDARKHLRENKYDIIHIHTSREYLFLKDVLLAKMINKEFQTPIVMTIHVGAMETVYKRIGWFKSTSIKLLNKYVSQTIFLSRVMRDEFIRDGLAPERSTVLYNFHNFTPTSRAAEHKDDLQLLFVGAIHREKGILELLHAIDQLPNLKCHLNVCGKITDKSIEAEINYLKDKLSDRVSFVGYITGEDKTVLFKQSDILILPSYHEGLPIVIMEALGAGCAIITTKVGAIPEILSNDNTSWVDVASVDSIKLALEEFTEDKLKVVKALNRKQGEKFSFVSHVNKLSEIYKTAESSQ